MKLKNSQVYEALPAVQELVKLRLPVRTSFRVAQLAVAVQRAFGPIEVARGKILETGVLKDDQGKPVPVLDAAGAVVEDQVKLTPEGSKEFAELMALESDVEADPLQLEELGDLEIAPSTLIGLGPLLAE